MTCADVRRPSCSSAARRVATALLVALAFTGVGAATLTTAAPAVAASETKRCQDLAAAADNKAANARSARAAADRAERQAVSSREAADRYPSATNERRARADARAAQRAKQAANEAQTDATRARAAYVRECR